MFVSGSVVIKLPLLFYFLCTLCIINPSGEKQSIVINFSYKNDRLITVANERVEIVKSHADTGFYELIIPDVQQEDIGVYKCIASNSHGEVECESNVTVTGTSHAHFATYYF